MGGVRSDQADSSKIGEQTRQRWKFTWAMACSRVPTPSDKEPLLLWDFNRG